MKNFTSVFALTAKHTLFKIIGIILLMAAVETGAFCLAMRDKQSLLFFEDTLRSMHITWIFFIAMAAAVFLLLRFTSSEGSCRPIFTLARLYSCPRTTVLAAGAYNTIMLFSIWTVQIALVTFFSLIYAEERPVQFYDPVTFLAFIRSDFITTLMPMGWLRMLSTLLLIGALGIAIGCSMVKRRDLNFTIMAVFLLIIIRMPKEGILFPLTVAAYFAGMICILIIVIFLKNLTTLTPEEDFAGGEQK